ncbi:unnamed protein product [Auanema sp. JU1783]|nr:unnamed protein product [Auanema sp. JU1783]
MELHTSACLIAFTLLGTVQCFSTLSKSPSGPTGRQMIFELESKMSCVYEPLVPGVQLVLDVDTYPAGTKGQTVQLRLTSPSNDFSDWSTGDGNAHMRHNVTESGDYEICFYSPVQMKVTFSMFFHSPEQLSQELTNHRAYQEYQKLIDEVIGNLFQQLYRIKYSIKYYNQIVNRDESVQLKNSSNIKMFSIVFSGIAFVVAVVNVTFIRRMFKVDISRIRI